MIMSLFVQATAPPPTASNYFCNFYSLEIL